MEQHKIIMLVTAPYFLYILPFFFLQLFMSPHFNLENPDIFNTVFPWTQVEGAKSNQSGSKQSSKLLQEKVVNTNTMLIFVKGS